MRCVTTYQVNRRDTRDQSYMDYETLATLAEITRRLKARRRRSSRAPSWRMTECGSVPANLL